jgi:hypothetical protein
MSDSPHPPNDEIDVDREIRIEKMRRELVEITGGKMISGNLGTMSSKMEEAFLEQALAYERAEFDTNFNRLVQRGVAMPPVAELDDATLSAKLTDVIRELGELRCFLHDTDHLSDRELYHWLWSSGLREDSPDISEMPGAAWHTSPIGGGDDEDTPVWLKYYADEEERACWHVNFPDDPMPAHEPPPFNRDRHLSQRSNF